MNPLATLALLASLSLPTDKVFVTAHGHRYHLAKHHVCGEQRWTTRAQAEADGYLPCKPCFRPAKGDTL